jgi:uncharacterized membrane protein YdjX (TVP38/TMEM64 family)
MNDISSENTKNKEGLMKYIGLKRLILLITFSVCIIWVWDYYGGGEFSTIIIEQYRQTYSIIALLVFALFYVISVIAAFVRINPIISARSINYLFSLTFLFSRGFMLAAFIFILTSYIAVAYIGDTLQTLVRRLLSCLYKCGLSSRWCCNNLQSK